MNWVRKFVNTYLEKSEQKEKERVKSWILLEFFLKLNIFQRLLDLTRNINKKTEGKRQTLQLLL